MFSSVTAGKRTCPKTPVASSTSIQKLFITPYVQSYSFIESYCAAFMFAFNQPYISGINFRNITYLHSNLLDLS
jgi:hypothetical protein